MIQIINKWSTIFEINSMPSLFLLWKAMIIVASPKLCLPSKTRLRLLKKGNNPPAWPTDQKKVRVLEAIQEKK